MTKGTSFFANFLYYAIMNATLLGKRYTYSYIAIYGEDVKRLEINELWVCQAKAGDDEAFAKIYECIYKDLYRYAYYMLGNEQDAEDVVSDAVMDMYAGLKKLRENAAFQSWAFKILSNKCRRKRKQYVNRNVSLDDEEVNVNLHTEEDFEQRQDLLTAFGMLTEEERDVVSLAVFGGYKSQEIGKILNLKATTVRSKLSRALGKMQKKMEIQC